MNTDILVRMISVKILCPERMFVRLRQQPTILLKNPLAQRVIEQSLFNVVIRNHGNLTSKVMLLISSIVIAEYAMQTFCIPVFLRYQTTD